MNTDAQARTASNLRSLRGAAAFLFVLLAALAVVRHGPGADGTFAVLVVGVLMLLSMTDIEQGIIPNRVVIPAWALALAGNTALHPDGWRNWVLASFGAASFFLIFAVLYPAGLGMGDVKLAGFLGAVLGVQVTTGIALGMFGSALFALAILAREGRAGRRHTFPLGPFLAGGAIVMLLTV